MSAFVVTNLHIDTLVTAALTVNLIESDQATAFGRMLLRENIKSVIHRYALKPQSKEVRDYRERVADYIYNPRKPKSDAELYMACECYDYQSCEHPDWDLSGARFAVKALFAYVDHVPHNERTYEQVGWGID